MSTASGANMASLRWSRSTPGRTRPRRCSILRGSAMSSNTRCGPASPVRCTMPAMCWAQPSWPSISSPGTAAPPGAWFLPVTWAGPTCPCCATPLVLTAADILLIESTYGSRTHPPIEESAGALKEIISRTSQRGGKVIIPAFAVERTQFLIYLLNNLYNQGELPDIPIYVDSPLAVNVTDIFRRHTDYFDAETQDVLRKDPDGDIFGFKRLRYIRDVEESKKLHSLHGPCVIISASGMAEAGRIQHHLKNNIEDSRNTIVIVGWQAPNTLGRRLVEQAPVVRIFGVEYHREAEVVTLNGFSNHADQPGLLSWARAFTPSPARTFVVHGDPDAAAELATRLRQDLGFPEVLIPALHQTVEV